MDGMSSTSAGAAVPVAAATAAARDLFTHLQALLPWHLDLYRDLHAHPELSFAETRTAALIADRLRNLGYRVTEGIGGTGVVGVLRNGDGPVVLARADIDGLPITETTGLDYASIDTATDADGRTVGVMHACGHDTHIATLLATAQLLAHHRQGWTGTVIALFQPAEEVGSGARAMVEDGLARIIPRPDVALAQHVGPLPHDSVATRAGLAMSAADSIRITVHGRGAHGSRPHNGIDPILLAGAIVVRLHGIVSRELAPGHFGVVTVGSVQAGAKSNIIPDSAQLLVNLRAYDEPTRVQLRAAVERIVRAECAASGSPREPEFVYYDSFNVTENSPDVHRQVAAVFDEHFGPRHWEMERSSGSEDFAEVPDAFGTPYLYWVFGSVDPDRYRLAAGAGTLATDIPANHASNYAPVPEPTLRTGIEAMTLALMSYLARP